MTDDLTSLPDEEFRALLARVLDEQERRLTLTSTPGQVTELAEKFVHAGGDTQTLIDAITT